MLRILLTCTRRTSADRDDHAATGLRPGFRWNRAIFNAVNRVANTVLSFINNTMRPLLEGIRSAAQALQGLLTQLRNLWEQVVWPSRR